MQQSHRSDDRSSVEHSKLSFPFRSRSIPVHVPTNISLEVAQRALESETFQNWVHRCETSRSSVETNTTDDAASKSDDVGGGGLTKCLNLHSVELQSIDLFGPRRVGFIKLKSHVTFIDHDESGGGKSKCYQRFDM
jgi:hypothetical protein